MAGINIPFINSQTGTNLSGLFFGRSGFVGTATAAEIIAAAGLAPIATSGSASDLTTGTVADARLSANVPLKNAANTFSGINTFSNTTTRFLASDNLLEFRDVANARHGYLWRENVTNNVIIGYGEQGSGSFQVHNVGITQLQLNGTNQFQVAANRWHGDLGGSNRYYFELASSTYHQGHGATPHIFINGAGTTLATLSSGGAANFTGALTGATLASNLAGVNNEMLGVNTWANQSLYSNTTVVGKGNTLAATVNYSATIIGAGNSVSGNTGGNITIGALNTNTGAYSILIGNSLNNASNFAVTIGYAVTASNGAGGFIGYGGAATHAGSFGLGYGPNLNSEGTNELFFGVPTNAGAVASFRLAGATAIYNSASMFRAAGTWIDSTHATRKARVILSTYDTAAREAIRMDATGSGAIVGIGGAADASHLLTVNGSAKFLNAINFASDLWQKDGGGADRIYFEGSSRTVIKGYGATPLQLRNGSDVSVATYVDGSGWSLFGATTLTSNFVADTWHTNVGGNQRFYFAANGASIWKGYGVVPHILRNGSDQVITQVLDSGRVTFAGNVSARDLNGVTGGLSASIAYGGYGHLALYDSSGAQIYLADNNFANTSFWNSAPGIGAVLANPSVGVTNELAFYVYQGVVNSRAEVGRFTSTGSLIVNNGLTIGGSLKVPVNAWHVDGNDAQRIYFTSGGKTIIRGYGTDPFEFRDGSGNAAAAYNTTTGWSFLGAVTLNPVIFGNNVWHTSGEGNQRFYFLNNSISYYRGYGSTPHVFRNASGSDIVSIDTGSQITLEGATAGINTRDRSTNETWTWYGNASAGRLYNSVAAADVFTITNTGNMTVIGSSTVSSGVLQLNTVTNNNGSRVDFLGWQSGINYRLIANGSALQILNSQAGESTFPNPALMSIEPGLASFTTRIENTSYYTTTSALRMGSFELQPFAINNAFLGDNFYYTGASFARRATGYASAIYFLSGDIQLRSYDTGAGGGLLNNVCQVKLTTLGTLAIGANIDSGAGILTGAKTLLYADGRITMEDMLIINRPGGAAAAAVVESPSWDTSYLAIRNGAQARTAATTALQVSAAGATGLNSSAGQVLALKIGNVPQLTFDGSVAQFGTYVNVAGIRVQDTGDGPATVMGLGTVAVGGALGQVVIQGRDAVTNGDTSILYRTGAKLRVFHGADVFTIDGSGNVVANGSYQVGGTGGPIIKNVSGEASFRNASDNGPVNTVAAGIAVLSSGVQWRDLTTGTEHWRFYKNAGDNTVFFRDMINARMQMAFGPGASAATANVTIYAGLTVEGQAIMGGGSTAGGGTVNTFGNNNYAALSIGSVGNNSAFRVLNAGAWWIGSTENVGLDFQTNSTTRFSISGGGTASFLGQTEIYGTGAANKFVIYNNATKDYVRFSVNSDTGEGKFAGASGDIQFLPFGGATTIRGAFLTLDATSNTIHFRTNVTGSLATPLALVDGTCRLAANQWHGDSVDLERLFFSGNGSTFYKGFGVSPHRWRNSTDTEIMSLTSTGNLLVAGTMQIGGGSGPLLKNGSGALQIRNSADSAFADLQAGRIDSGNGSTFGALGQDNGIRGSNLYIQSTDGGTHARFSLTTAAAGSQFKVGVDTIHAGMSFESVPIAAGRLGYIAWFQGNGTRQAYMGYDNDTRLTLNIESGGAFNLTTSLTLQSAVMLKRSGNAFHLRTADDISFADLYAYEGVFQYNVSGSQLIGSGAGGVAYLNGAVGVGSAVWLHYTANSNALYLRDGINGRMQVTYSGGASASAALVTYSSRVTVESTIRGNASVDLYESTNYTRIMRTSDGRLTIYRPNDTSTPAVSFGGGNDEISVRSGLGLIAHSGANFSVIAPAGGGTMTVGSVDSNVFISAGGGDPLVQVTGRVTVSNNLQVSGATIVASSPPANASAAGVAGTITYDSDYIYVCTATNTWKRAALATW